MGAPGLNTVKSRKFDDILEEPEAVGQSASLQKKSLGGASTQNLGTKTLEQSGKRPSVINTNASKKGSNLNLVRNPTEKSLNGTYRDQDPESKLDGYDSENKD